MCDRIAIVDAARVSRRHARVVAPLGAVAAARRARGARRRSDGWRSRARSACRSPGRAASRARDAHAQVPPRRKGACSARALRASRSAAFPVQGVATRETSLEDAFIHIVGRIARRRRRARVSCIAPPTRRCSSAVAARARGVRIVGSFRANPGLFADAVFPNPAMRVRAHVPRVGAPPYYEALAVIGGIPTTYCERAGDGRSSHWGEAGRATAALLAARRARAWRSLTGMAVGGLLASMLRLLVGVALAVFVFRAASSRSPPWHLAAVFCHHGGAVHARHDHGEPVPALRSRGVAHVQRVHGAGVLPSGLISDPHARRVRAVAAAILPLTLGGRVAPGAARRALARLLPVLGVRGALRFRGCFTSSSRAGRCVTSKTSKREGRLTQRWQ